MTRNVTLDITRTLAIVLMVVFHFIYDLKFFEIVDWDTPDGDGWKHFRWVIITLFFLCLGISLTLAHGQKFHSNKFFTRFVQIASAGIAISIVTLIAIPNNWIFFGVLHFLAFASMVVVLFVKRPIVSFIMACSIMFIGILQILPSRWPFYFIFENLPRYTNDYVAIFPWLGMVFFGVCIAHTTWFRSDPLAGIALRLKKQQLNLILWPGQHSLSIYLVHQPLMIGTLYLILLI